MTTTRMRSRAARAGASSLLALACLLVSVSVARAQHTAYPVHDTFEEQGRFPVENTGRVTVAHRTVPAPPPGSARSAAEIMADMDAHLARMEALSVRLDGLSRVRRPDRRTLARMRRLSRLVSAQAAHVRQLRHELAHALRNRPGDWDAPVRLEPPVTILPVPGYESYESDSRPQRRRPGGRSATR